MTDPMGRKGGGDSAGGWKVGQTCDACGYVCAEETRYQPDPCLGHLPGVAVACCGHGGEGYIGWDLPGSTRVGSDVVVRFKVTSIERDGTHVYVAPTHGDQG